jgi:hypothetical protein
LSLTAIGTPFGIDFSARYGVEAFQRPHDLGIDFVRYLDRFLGLLYSFHESRSSCGFGWVVSD